MTICFRSIVRPLGAALASATLVATIPFTSAAAATADQTAIGSWLAGELDGGLVTNDYGVDHGLSVDVFVALHELGVEPGAASAIITGLSADPAAYVTGEAFGDAGSTYAGSTGKLVTAVELSGADARDVAGDDLVTRLESTIVTEGADTGRAKDVSTWGDYSNLIGQAWVVRALALTGSALLDEATGHLLAQQCASGSFRLELGASGCTAHHDATTFALEALVAAQDAGVDGLADDIEEAADALEAAQAADGSLQDMDAPNANTTGRAAWALRLAGHDAAADRATAWVRDLLVTSGPEAGAIAYDPAAFEVGKDGIADPLRDQWLRATSQAALAFVGAAAPEPTPTPTPEPTPTPTPEPTPTTPVTAPTPNPTEGPAEGPTDEFPVAVDAGNDTGADATSDGAFLPATGAGLGPWWLAAGALLLGGGAGTVLLARRRA